MIYQLKGTYASHMQNPLFAFFFQLRLFAFFFKKEAALSTGAVQAPHRRACSGGVEA